MYSTQYIRCKCKWWDHLKMVEHGSGMMQAVSGLNLYSALQYSNSLLYP